SATAGRADLPRRAAHRRRQGTAQRGAGRLPSARDRAAVPDLAGEARGRGLPSRRRGAAAAEPSRRRPAAAAIRPRRGPPLRSALSPHPPPQEITGRVGREEDQPRITRITRITEQGKEKSALGRTGPLFSCCLPCYPCHPCNPWLMFFVEGVCACGSC